MTKRPRTAAPPPPPSPPVPLTHPAFLFAALVAAACVVVSVSTRLMDTDLWQHLAVGRAIWALHHVPRTQLWTWPTYGVPDVNASWGFRALIWPIWHAWGVPGLFAWRWVTTLLAFGVLWATARRMGANGFSALVVLVVCSLTYRQRSAVRPETLVAVLMALQLWILESRRRLAPDTPLAKDPTPWLIVIALAWANAHISYYVGWVLLAIHLVGTVPLGGKRTKAVAAAEWRAWKRLLVVSVLCAAISFVNPWGWAALWQPFEYFLHWRHEPIFQTIGELKPIVWSNNLHSGLPLLVLGWPALILWRATRGGLDVAEALTCAFFTTIALGTQRFLGSYALAAAPYVARGVHDAWHASREVSWLRPAWARAALTAAACVAVGIPEWTRGDIPMQFDLGWVQYPIRACDYIESHHLSGRSYNPFSAGGYMVYRFWPDRGRLPFMDIHQAGTREDRTLYAYAQGNPPYWRQLDAKYHFDYALLFRHEYLRETLMAGLDADSTWSRVFLDDAAALYLRRGGRFDSLARADAYHLETGSAAGLNALGAACAADTAVRARARAEFEREIRESPWHAHAASLLANIAQLDGKPDEVERLLREALRVDPSIPLLRLRLGLLALERGRPRDALAAFADERRGFGNSPTIQRSVASAWKALGDHARARDAYAAALRLDPGDQAARDSLAAEQGR